MSLVDIRSVTITNKGQISIPKLIRESVGFADGDKVAILSYDDHIELRPMDKISEKLYPALMSEKALAKNWLRPEEEKAWRNL